MFAKVIIGRDEVSTVSVATGSQHGKRLEIESTDPVATAPGTDLISLYQRIKDTIRSMTIPKRRHARRGCAWRIVYDVERRLDDLRGSGAGDCVGAHLNCDGALGIFP